MAVVNSQRANVMWKAINRSLNIDMRRSAEALMLGPLEKADAYVPFVVIDRDEWMDCIEAYKKRTNNIFLQRVDDLLLEYGLSRSSTIRLIASSYYQGILAANLLEVAGYGSVVVEVGSRSDTPGCCVVSRENNLSTAGSRIGYQWTDATTRELSGVLH